MVSNSRNIPSRGATPGVVMVSSVVGAVAKVSILRSTMCRRTLYMHVHNCIRDGECDATSGWLNGSFTNWVLAARIASRVELAAGRGLWKVAKTAKTAKATRGRRDGS